MSLHSEHRIHENTMEVYYLYMDIHRSLEERCYHFIRIHPGCCDLEVAKGLIGDNARRQDVAPRINQLLFYGTDEYTGPKKHMAIKESGRKYITTNGIAKPVRTLEVINSPEQLELV